MLRRDHHTTSPSGSARSHPAAPRGGVGSVLALQRALGNRDTARLLARKGGATRGTFENSVQIGKLGPIEIKDGNVGDWLGKKQPRDLVLTTAMGKHSTELKRLSDGKTRIDSIAVQSITGQNSWAIITFKNARIRGYTPDTTSKTEEWQAIDFDAVNIKRTAIGVPRP